MTLLKDALSHSCTKLENRDFVSNFAERTEDSTAVILLINDRSKPSLRASSPIWASEVSLLSLVPRSRVLARLASLAGELARMLVKTFCMEQSSFYTQRNC